MVSCMGQLKFQWERFKIKLRMSSKNVYDTKGYVVCKGSSSNHMGKSAKKELCELKYENINKGIRMLMYVVLHGNAQIQVGKAQNQAQNELKRTCLGHQGICSM